MKEEGGREKKGIERMNAFVLFIYFV